MSVCESVHTTTTTVAKLWLHNAHRHPDVLHTHEWACKVVPLQPNESKLQLDVYLCLFFPLSNLSHSCILVIIKILRCCSDGENRAASFFFSPLFPNFGHRRRRRRRPFFIATSFAATWGLIGRRRAGRGGRTAMRQCACFIITGNIIL